MINYVITDTLHTIIHSFFLLLLLATLALGETFSSWFPLCFLLRIYFFYCLSMKRVVYTTMVTMMKPRASMREWAIGSPRK